MLLTIPLCDRLRDGHRAAHRQHHVAHLQPVGIAPRGHRQGNVRVLAGLELQFQHGDVGQRIGAHPSCLDLVAVGQRAGDPHGVAGHVMVGDHVSIAGDDGPAAGLPHPLHPSARRLLGHDVDSHQGRINFLDRRFDRASARRAGLLGRRGRRPHAHAQRHRHQQEDRHCCLSCQVVRHSCLSPQTITFQPHRRLPFHGRCSAQKKGEITRVGHPGRLPQTFHSCRFYGPLQVPSPLAAMWGPIRFRLVLIATDFTPFGLRRLAAAFRGRVAMLSLPHAPSGCRHKNSSIRGAISSWASSIT